MRPRCVYMYTIYTIHSLGAYNTYTIYECRITREPNLIRPATYRRRSIKRKRSNSI